MLPTFSKHLIWIMTVFALVDFNLNIAWAGPAEDEAVKLCDQLAAAIPDKTKPAGVPGVKGGDIDGPAAVAACEKAATAFPDNMRLQFQYGRALIAADQMPNKVFELYTKAATGGHIIAMNNLGYVYENAIGTPKDHTAALKWYQKAAELGFSVAQRNTGLFYQNGKGIPKDGKTAEMWFNKAAAQGDASAKLQLGLLYDEGNGVPQDYAKAVAFYKQALEGGDPQAYSNMGWAYDRGIGGLPVDHVKANEFYLEGSAKGDSNSMNNYAESLVTGEGVAKDTKAGMEWMNKAFDAGSSRAAYNLGQYYSKGEIVMRDIEKSADYYITSLERNADDSRALFIGKGGEGVPADVINLMQDKLLKRGGVFEKHDGSFGKGGEEYMEQVLNGG
jgi:TPR repeat protein